MKRFILTLLFLLAASARGQQLFNLFDHARAPGTVGDLLCVSTTAGLLVPVHPSGTAGKVLTENSGACPSFQTAPGGTSVADDNSLFSFVYPTWVAAAGSSPSFKISTTNFKFNPLAGILILGGSAPSVTADEFKSTAGVNVSLDAPPAVAAATTQVGAGVDIFAANAVPGTSTPGAAHGGNVEITSGNADRLTSGDANGGDILLVTGTGIGTGAQGIVKINGAPAAIGPGSSTTGHMATFAGADGATLADGGAPATGSVTSISTTSPATGCASPCTTTATIGVSDMVAAGGSHARGTVPDPGVTTHSPAYYLGDDAAFHSVLTAIPTARYELSTTAANGVTSTFSFPVAVTSVTTVFVGGVAQTPSDISISGGNVVLGVNITPPPAGVEVSALYNGTVSGTGSVTSVGATGPSGLFTWSNTPITTSGTLTAALNSQSAHTFLGGLTSGSGTPAFRLLDPSDIPPSQGGTGANNTATADRYLKGNGTAFVTSSGAASGTGSCTNQVVVGLNPDASPTCASISLAYGAGVDVQVYNTPGTHTWTKPVNASFVLAECWGSGGGGASGGTAVGGGSPQAITSGGGGGGAYSRKTFKASSLGSSETVTVGAGGTGGASSTYGSSGAHNGNPGGDGATSSFGTKLKAGGGAGGASDPSSGLGGGGGGVIGNASSINGGAPSGPGNGSAISGQGATAQAAGSAAEYGGGAGSYGNTGTPGGGDSIYGSGGGGRGGGISAVFVCNSPSAGGGVGTYGLSNGGAAGTSNSGSSGAVTGTAGTDGATVNESGTGAGGGGSACNTGVSGSATGGPGGKGGAPGGGGGGGGSARFDYGTQVTGKGGDGADGMCRITTW